jgi:hypothetical protein
MSSYSEGLCSALNTRASDNEGDVNIRVKTAFLPWMHTMLGDVVAIVRRVKYIGVVELAGRVKTTDHPIYHLIHRLQGSQPASLVLVVVINDTIVQFR